MKDENRSCDNLRDRTEQFALKIIRFYSLLPSKINETQIIGKQLLRSGTSVGANYREAYRARSNSEFISKIGIVIQELDETDYWLEQLRDAKINGNSELQLLLSETDKLLAIFTTLIIKKVRKN
jgi:four helix bundle protein